MTKATWAIEAEAKCAASGHAEFDTAGRCNRCREYNAEHDMAAQRDASRRAAFLADDLDDDDISEPCPHYTDQGCPLHGETCAS
jgi:predicted ATP-dependent serine protease